MTPRYDDCQPIKWRWLGWVLIYLFVVLAVFALGAWWIT